MHIASGDARRYTHIGHRLIYFISQSFYCATDGVIALLTSPGPGWKTGSGTPSPDPSSTALEAAVTMLRPALCILDVKLILCFCHHQNADVMQARMPCRNDI